MHGTLSIEREMESPVITKPKDYLIARVVHRSDAQALEALARYNVETYYPQTMELRPVPQRKLSTAQRNSGNRVQCPVKVPMFPRYVMFEELSNWDRWDEIREQSGIAGFATNNNKVAKIPSSAIEQIKRENGELIDARKSARIIFNIGEEVGIASGAFASFPAIVEEKLDIPLADLDPETRLIVLVNIFGRQTRTELEIWQVAKRD